MNSDVKFVDLSCTPTPASPQSKFFAPTSASPQRSKTKQQHAANRHVARSILRTRKPRKSRIVFNFTAEEMAPYYHLPQREAAKLLGVAVITIKRTCKRRGIRWPYRDAKLKQIQDARASAALRRAQQPELRISGVTLLSDAAVAFARLPFACMEENTNTWVGARV